MATKRGDKSKHELVTLANNKRREDEYIERLVLSSDTLQGIALLYNTSVAELKKLNHLHKDTDLHGRRIIKVPSRGILVDLTDAPPSPPLHVRDDGNSEESDEESTNGQIYLSNVDTALQEIREKAETVAANSVVLQTSNSNETLLTPFQSKNEDIAWWKIALPCIGVLFVLPYLYYLYLEHLEYIHHTHSNASSSTTNDSVTPHSQLHY
ncbi:lysM and putative peptidoglycan-binding domain-containing protein 3 isoform X2 [Folsomia candida]|uniref:lysM and putative peptidoglycan-binding domain-containing protein 3 isoform X2 n=1 Tax=Folsomia candida TaxID=158441 RepID=UPI000B8EFE8E|nr:lysM and putative peptidoglycan-binding domain-containing protein 3 isoform X2 [Folsomia candida]